MEGKESGRREKCARIYSRYFRDTALEADEVECWRERDGGTEAHFRAYFWLTIIDKRPAQGTPGMILSHRAGVFALTGDGRYFLRVSPEIQRLGVGTRGADPSEGRLNPALGGDHQPSLHHQQFNAAQQLHPLHPHHLPPPHGQYGTPPSRHTTMDLESPLPRGYPPPSTMLFDDDPGIMSEVETSSTGFRRGGKQRSSLPVVRTPSKTLERPLGLVFLQYRNETKRALLPNEITSIDTVKALFVRSFPKQLTMEYLDSPHVKVYIHDSNKDMFYELEDLRSHLRDIRDRSVLRLFESADGVTGMPGPLGVPGGGGGLPPHWEDQSYFSEPEFDSEYQHQHIHKSKVSAS
ncbi:Coiled-coil domain-containing protein [Acromyrmex echinatior]|uniref:Coiled-coil domain-containing protein n=1 Tax=Acromyrmex echinatior TaxID=103372 RepID=F4X3I0_ACREC|nr:Coiled-coil domain-containing protein [Acromyrmex echinatior]